MRWRLRGHEEETKKRESKLLLITVQNKTIRTKYIKVKMWYTSEYHKCKLCCDRDAMVNRIVCEHRKLPHLQKKKIPVWVRVLHINLWQGFKTGYGDQS